MQKIRNHKRCASILMLLCILLLLCSMLYSIHEQAEHDCIGVHCPVCLHLQSRVDPLGKTMLSGGSGLFPAALLAGILYHYIPIRLRHLSPVLCGVRLNT